MTTDNPRQQTWHKPAFHAAAVLLAGVALIGIVVALSTLSDIDWQLFDPPPAAAPAREVEIQPYAAPPPQQAPEWPSSPARRQAADAPPSTANALRVARSAGAEPLPTTLPSGEFIAAVESGRKVFLPNPAGQCDLVGNTGPSLTRAFDDCFAGKRTTR